MHLCSRTSPFLALCALLVLLAGCADALRGVNPTTRYYVLDAVSGEPTADSAAAQVGPVIGVSPIDLPEYLNQPGITIRGPANEVVRAEYDQWGGPLTSEVTRVVGENLSRMLPSDRVTIASSSRTIPFDFIVGIEVSAFERDQAGAVQLIARWAIFRDADQSVVTMRTSRITRTGVGTDYNAIVTAMSGALADLCREIASEIAAQPRPAT